MTDKILVNNSDEVNEKIEKLLAPILEYLSTLTPDNGSYGFFSEKDNVFKSAQIRITIKETYGKQGNPKLNKD